MIVYIDSLYKCHMTNDGTMREYEVSYFDGKGSTFIEGHRYVPPYEVRIGDDGTEYQGEQITPFMDYTELKKAQLEYEIEQFKAQNAEYETALSEIETALGVTSE